MLKYMRIAVTVLCLTACLLLVVLWVRSHWTSDYIGNSRIEVSAISGVVQIAVLSSPASSGWLWTSYRVNSQDMALPAFNLAARSGISYINVPHWFLLLTLATLGVTPWIKWSRRFSMRTLIVAMTLVAAVLGAIAFNTTRRTAQPPIDVGDFGSPFEVTR